MLSDQTLARIRASAQRFDRFKARYRKGFVAGLGFLAELVEAGLVHGTAETVILLAIGAATAAGVTIVPNAPAPVPPAPPVAG